MQISSEISVVKKDSVLTVHTFPGLVKNIIIPTSWPDQSKLVCYWPIFIPWMFISIHNLLTGKTIKVDSNNSYTVNQEISKFKALVRKILW